MASRASGRNDAKNWKTWGIPSNLWRVDVHTGCPRAVGHSHGVIEERLAFPHLDEQWRQPDEVSVERGGEWVPRIGPRKVGRGHLLQHLTVEEAPVLMRRAERVAAAVEVQDGAILRHPGYSDPERRPAVAGRIVRTGMGDLRRET
jgi:hypothetical protein